MKHKLYDHHLCLQGSKDQFEEVWEKKDHLEDQEFNPKTFFKLHGMSRRILATVARPWSDGHGILHNYLGDCEVLQGLILPWWHWCLYYQQQPQTWIHTCLLLYVSWNSTELFLNYIPSCIVVFTVSSLPCRYWRWWLLGYWRSWGSAAEWGENWVQMFHRTCAKVWMMSLE